MDDLDFDEFQDICGLGEIFPDIEPYLKEVTTTFEIARADSRKDLLDRHIDGSDSDSGISGDSFATGILKNLEISLCNDLSANHKTVKGNNPMCGIKLLESNVTENFKETNVVTSNMKNIIITPTSVSCNNERTVLNIVRNSSDSSIVKPKQIIIKSHQPFTPLTYNVKRESGNVIPKVTNVKILKNNEGYPVISNGNNQSFSIKSENKSLSEYSKINIKEVEQPHDRIPKNIAKNDSNSNISSNKNVFLSDIPTNSTISSDYQKLKNDIYESKAMSFEINDFQSMDCSESYYDMFQSSPSTTTNILSSSPYNSFNNCNGVINSQQFDRIIKKQERMIKNRQAASLSRQRKKEYVERLEHKSELLKLENQHLQNQVTEIKERFCALEQENQLIKRDVQMWRDRYYDLERQKIKQGIPSVNKPNNLKTIDISSKSRVLKTTAASTTVLGIFLLLTFNFNSWTDINQKVSFLTNSPGDRNIPILRNNNENFAGQSVKKKIIGNSGRIGRTLFSINENTSLLDNPLSKEVPASMCNSTGGLNLTETTRLTLELNKWGSRYNAESVKEFDRIQNAKIKSQILNKEINSIYKRSKLRYYHYSNDKQRAFNSAELEVYQRNSGYNFLDSFFNDIDQKPDTLYFVSFHSDNFIYPATAHSNNFSTPKITLLLPADVKQDDEMYYRMMKIDCNVQNFTVVNLKKTRQP